MILGIDEVGRGPWAGPLVVGAVVLGGIEIPGLTDSKKLTKKQREALDQAIREKALGFGLGWVDATEIDEVGLSEALRLATRRAVEQVHAPYHEIIIDGTINFLADTGKGKYVKTLKKADLLIPSVSAASIIAKVARDNYMAEQDRVYPGYHFAAHVGYGTAAHRAAIDQLGVTPLHRLSFAPLQKYRGQTPAVRQVAHGHTTSTRAIGDTSETAAARYLEKSGHAILDRNWRTRWCEIDIVSERDNTLYFTEVKHRRSDQSGGGFDAITTTKRRQMTFAAELYAMNHPGYDLRLAVIATDGDTPRLVDYLELE